MQVDIIRADITQEGIHTEGIICNHRHHHVITMEDVEVAVWDVACMSSD